MLDWLIGFSVKNRWLVVLAALATAALGLVRLESLPIDVFPDLNRPTVTIMTEAPGLAPEEVEALVARPLEYLLNGTNGVRRVRSSSGIGLAVIWVEFDWGSDILTNRQVVAERLQLAKEKLPEKINPVLAPVSSIMGEVMIIGLLPATMAVDQAAQKEQAMGLRTLGEFTVRNRLLAVEGVAQVTVLGGLLRQYQIITSPDRLAARDVTLRQLLEAAGKANVLTGGGLMEQNGEEMLIRIRGQSITPDDIGETPVIWRDRVPIRIRDVATVGFGGPVRRGEGAATVRLEDGLLSGGDAVILAVQKQPGTGTLALTPRLDSALDSLQRELSSVISIQRHIFRQADFISRAIENVVESIRDGAIWVTVVLLLFLANFRTSMITLAAIPLSVLITVLVFSFAGASINTMTLGGIAVAVGELVDDAIVDIENIHRRLCENATRENPAQPLVIIHQASCEVRGTIVYATLIVCLVTLPFFALTGLEGRMFAPLALAYVTALTASLLVSLTVTPALAAIVLPGARFLQQTREPPMVRLLKWVAERLVRWSLRHPVQILTGVALLAIGSKLLILPMGSEFLPPFSEGTLTLSLQTRPGTSLQESSRMARLAEKLVWQVPEVVGIARRTGRAEQDEHAEGVNVSEMEIRLTPHRERVAGLMAGVYRAIPGLGHLGYAVTGRNHETVMADLREQISLLPAVVANIGQPISHRLDHVMSGVRSQIAIKLFGDDLRMLAECAQETGERLRKVRGVTDLQVEPQENIRQVRLEVDRIAAASYGLAPGDVAGLLEVAYKGRTVSTVLDQDRFFDLVVWYDEESRADRAVIGQTILDTPSGRKVALTQVARVIDARGPNTINREGTQRRVVVACNAQGRDLGSLVQDIRLEMNNLQQGWEKMGRQVRLDIGGQFEARQRADIILFWLFWMVLAGVFLLLNRCLGSWVAAAMVLLINIPLAALGSVIALLLINQPSAQSLANVPWWRWPEVWAAATTLSVAHWVGFITLVGIVSRNGILMISHYIYLAHREGQHLDDELIVRGTLERLKPVLMTACTAVIGLVPLALGAGEPGKEILHPLAIVVIGGLIDSTLLDQIVTPAAFKLFGARVLRQQSSTPKQLQTDQ
ncbi:MAG: efflux RND transporter permease subunit [Planctomycetota bacterium]|nr:MAG: efflux RND transporter permease subunit [Planctomycetota bacterium]